MPVPGKAGTGQAEVGCQPGIPHVCGGPCPRVFLTSFPGTSAESWVRSGEPGSESTFRVAAQADGPQHSSVFLSVTVLNSLLQRSLRACFIFFKINPLHRTLGPVDVSVT